MMINYGRYKMVKGRKKYLPFKYYIGESIRPAYWNKRTNRVKETKAFPQHSLFNQRLSHIENIVQNSLLYFKHSGDLSDVDYLREMLDNGIKKKNLTEHDCRKNLFFFIEQFIDEAEKTKSLSTVRQYKNTFRLLMDFSVKVQKIDFQNIDMSFYANFKGYMDRAGYSETYFSNQIKYVRLFMNEATERGYNEHTLYKSRKFICPQVTVDKIYLTTKEIERIRTVKLSGSEKMEKIRDMFVIACHTGLRFSDLVRLQPSNFNVNEKILHIRTQKTDATVYIPLSPETFGICKKYNFQLPSLSNSTFNTCLKEIARQAGLVEDVELSISKGNRKIQYTMSKYQLITSHTARRSFATNAFLANVPNISIMQITGHATEKAFMRYIRVSGEDNARRLLTHPYFSKK
ncbi:MAG: site-specific integrase [Prevotellaceae bacterium]|nr:site-specific integrase [Prevotellaceae bacterium]